MHWIAASKPPIQQCSLIQPGSFIRRRIVRVQKRRHKPQGLIRRSPAQDKHPSLGRITEIHIIRQAIGITIGLVNPGCHAESARRAQGHRRLVESESLFFLEIALLIQRERRNVPICLAVVPAAGGSEEIFAVAGGLDSITTEGESASDVYDFFRYLRVLLVACA